MTNQATDLDLFNAARTAGLPPHRAARLWPVVLRMLSRAWTEGYRAAQRDDERGPR